MTDAQNGSLVSNENPILAAYDLAVQFPIKKGVFGRTNAYVRAVDGVDLALHQGETLGLVGESGCGKTTLGKSIARIVAPTGGRIVYRNERDEIVDVTTLSPGHLAEYRRQVRVVFQDPYSSLNPRMTILQIVGEPLVANGIASGRDLEERVAEMLIKVGLSPKDMYRNPHAFSGGQRQRVNIARALILSPRIVIADEPVSALDVSVRGQILNLLLDLQMEFALTYLFISHDLSVVESICDRVAVMYLGKIVEFGDTSNLYTVPKHPYTEALLSAIPRPDPRQRESRDRILIADDLPDPSSPPPGCAFHTRCPYVSEDRCTTLVPERITTAPTHQSACHHSATLRLKGIDTPLVGEEPAPFPL